MTAAALGFAASYVQNGIPLRFDIDPKDRAKDFTGLETVIAKIDKAVVDYLKKNNSEPAGKVNAGLAPDYGKGAVIMGVYKLANQTIYPATAPTRRLLRRSCWMRSRCTKANRSVLTGP